MQFLMPDKPMSRDAEVSVLLGLHQIIGGPFKVSQSLHDLSILLCI